MSRRTPDVTRIEFRRTAAQIEIAHLGVLQFTPPRRATVAGPGGVWQQESALP